MKVSEKNSGSTSTIHCFGPCPIQIRLREKLFNSSHHSFATGNWQPGSKTVAKRSGDFDALGHAALYRGATAGHERTTSGRMLARV